MEVEPKDGPLVERKDNQPDDITFSCSTLTDYIPAVEEKPDYVAMVSFKAPKMEQNIDRAPLQIVCVVDRSGSMSSAMKLLIETLEFVISQMTPNDQFGVVTFDNQIETILPLTIMNAAGKELAIEKCKEITSRGCTNLAGGLFEGIRLHLMKERAKNIVASVMLLTDGQANEGITKSSLIVQCLQNMLNNPFPEGKLRKNPSDFDSSLYLNMNNIANNLNDIDAEVEAEENEFQEAECLQQSMTPPPIQQMQQPQVMMPSPPIQQMQMQQQMQGFFPSFGGDDQSLEPMTEEEKKEAKAKIKSDMPSIYTFGFTSSHDERLLSDIAEAGNGSYYFIDEKENIGVAFSDCLGGLASVYAQKVNLTISSEVPLAIDNVKTHYKKTKVSDNVFNVNFGDIQAEENRDLLCVLKVPRIQIASDTPFKLLSTRLNYFNVIDKKNQEKNSECFVLRTIEKNTPTINLAIQAQVNRFNVVEAINQSSDFANNGDLEAARKVLNDSKEALVHTACASSDVYSNATNHLVSDIENALKGVQDSHSYDAFGKKQSVAMSISHSKQRANIATKNQYSNVSRSKCQSSYKMFKK